MNWSYYMPRLDTTLHENILEIVTYISEMEELYGKFGTL